MKVPINAQDGKGQKSVSRYQAALIIHPERAEGLLAKQRIEVGCSLLDDAGKTIGSLLIVYCEIRRALDAYLPREASATK